MSELYGIDREIHSKIQSKYSVENEAKARAWIESIIDESFQNDDFYESLRDGVVLCKLINKLVPGSGKYKVSAIPFMQMENIARFLEGAGKLGVPKHDLFQTIDLYEKKNMTQVVDAIFSVSRYAYKTGACLTYLGPKLADKQSNNFSQQQLNESNTVYSTFQYGYNKGANQSGMTTFGARRQISGDKQ